MRNANISKLIVAAGIYALFAVYLFGPHFRRFQTLQYLLPINICLAALGCYILSRRWVSAFWGSFFAGAVYGFGPFMLSLLKFHPTATFLAAAIPWLFLPAAVIPARKWRWLSIPLSTVPFLAIVLLFQIGAHWRLFPSPTQHRMQLNDLAGLLAPLVMTGRSIILVGFYHIPIGALIIGFLMLLKAKRFGIIIIFAIGTILAMCNSFWQVSPIIWLSIPILIFSVLVGVGLQGLVVAGYHDRKWVLAVAILMSVLAVAALLVATRYFEVFAGLGKESAKLFIETAKLYILGGLTVAVIFFLIRAKLRVNYLRWIILCSAMAVDIFLGARFIIDKTL